MGKVKRLAAKPKKRFKESKSPFKEFWDFFKQLIWWKKFILCFTLLFLLSLLVVALALGQLSKSYLWSNIKDVLLVVGYIVAVATYWRNSENRKKDIANKKFDTTIDAVRYFNNDVVKALRKSRKAYLEVFGKETDKEIEEYNASFDKESSLYYKNSPVEALSEMDADADFEVLDNVNDETLKKLWLALSISSAFEDGEFGDSFQRLNLLSSYFYYETVNSEQLYSNIADEVHLFLHIKYLKELEYLFDEKYSMNNYLNLIDGVEDYIKGRNERYASRPKNI